MKQQTSTIIFATTFRTIWDSAGPVHKIDKD